ncbi:MAG TPA: xanthine dehydrogenase family protein molybdopterin-binding subunit, partial [Anaerolineae bacterium]|nr:xanthine dehydrogenase family protein molybdopterin-binding subunit [Anaerolineae bacterium]
AQSEGGIVQGLGYALLEDTVVEGGRILTPSLATYLIPTIADVPPQVQTVILESREPEGPYGAKGIAEIVLTPTAAAILNAVHAATGRRFTTIPLTPERVVAAL